MYKIIGADGRVYGPVSVAQLRQWMAEGRAGFQTRVQTEGSSEWVPLGSLPEFADASAVAPPPMVAAEAQREAREVLSQDYRINIGDCIGRAWELIKRDFWFLVGASIVAGLIGAGGFIPYLSAVAGLIIGGPMMGGLNALYLKKIRGQSANFGDIFLGSAQHSGLCSGLI